MPVATQSQVVPVGPADRELLMQLQQAQDRVRLLQFRLEDGKEKLRPEAMRLQDSRLAEVLDLSAHAVQQLERRSQFLQARLQELGEEAEDDAEPDAVRIERAQLQRAVATLQAELKVARLVQVEAEQTRQLLRDAGQRHEDEQLWKRSPSLLFLEGVPQLRQAWPSDSQKLSDYVQQWRQTLARSSWKQGEGSLWLVLAALLVGAVLLRILPTLITRHAPGGRLRRSGLAMANFMVWMGMAWIVGKEIMLLLLDRPGLSEPQLKLVAYTQLAAFMGALVLAAMKAVIFQPRSSWRLLPLSDRGQRRLRCFPWLFMLTTYVEFLADMFRTTLPMSEIFLLSVDGVDTVLYLVLFVYGLWGLRAERFLSAQPPTGGKGQGLSERGYYWSRLAYYGAAGIYTLALLLFLGGWQGLADDLISHFLTMMLVFGSIGYLLMVLLQDICDSLLARLRERNREADESQARVQSQVIVVVFGLARVSVLALTIWIISSDWLSAPKQMLESGLDVSREVLRLSAVQWRLDLWLIALGVMLLGVFVIQVLRNWLRHRFMPNTSLEPGLQNAIASTVSYVGYFVLLVVCLSMLGVPIESVTWIFTALTVGVGFGLRGIVQNFASGLVLMLERSVKVGDWVEVDGSEGTVREIRMRATYVEKFDRSMLTVPNADMVGRQVRNLTYTPASLGAVEARLLLPLDVDADLVMELLQQAVRAQPEILEDPPAQLFCDGIQGDGLAFGMRCFLASMHPLRRVRSNLMLDLLRRLRAHGISLHPAQRWLVQEGGRDAEESARS
ncbi:mechanosensitive ion channel domain-containing protein [Alcaligenes sp. WGS1538]|uniref:mechanosensitive ion channel family protein n=1 Tax=Alcaligenes sp. WGS1538 TaxID=3366811 RepID=UPI00372D7072